MRPRFQADADFNQKIVAGLRRREPAIDILSAREGCLIGLPDLEVLRVAADAERILLTHDRTTMPNHLATFQQLRASPGVIVIAQSLEIGLAIEELLLIWAATDAAEWTGQLSFVPI